MSPGTTVRWVNTLDVFHTVTFADRGGRRVSNGTFDRSLATAGAMAERRFDTPGTFSYFCQPHSAFMAGRVTVDAGARGAGDDAGAAVPVRSALVVAAVVAVVAGLLLLAARRRPAPPSA